MSNEPSRPQGRLVDNLTPQSDTDATNNSMGNVLESALQLSENSFHSAGQNKSSMKNTNMTVVSNKQFLFRNANGLKDYCTIREKLCCRDKLDKKWELAVKLIIYIDA